MIIVKREINKVEQNTEHTKGFVQLGHEVETIIGISKFWFRRTEFFAFVGIETKK
jgi:hypothetical protein